MCGLTLMKQYHCHTGILSVNLYLVLAVIGIGIANWQLAAILVSQSKHLAAADFVMHMLCFQLIRECKDVLYAATLVKQYYQFMVDPVMLDEQEAEEKFAADLDQFDQDLRSMLEVGCCCLSVCYCS